MAELAQPCLPHTRDYASAKRSIAALDRRIDALAPDADPSSALAELRALLGTPCFRLAEGEAPSLEMDSSLALRTFWRAGGHTWLGSYLRLGEALAATGKAAAGGLEIVLPPGPRATVAIETAQGHPLSNFLCSLKDPACGTETRGWTRRAELTFHHFVPDRPTASTRAIEEVASACEPTTAETPGPHLTRYAEWRACIEHVANHRLGVPALPLAPMKAPNSGWLFVRGHRGHHSFCDGIAAYDLATGAAYTARRCHSMVIRPGVSPTRDEVTVGRVPVENLREAVWMMLRAGDAQPRVLLDAVSVPLPRGVRPERHPGISSRRRTAWARSTAQTTLTWSLVDQGALEARGTLRWPFDGNPVGNHAVRLFQVAEEGLVPGCPPARLPQKILFRPEDGVSTTPQVLAPLHVAQLTELRAATGRACAPGGARR